MRFDSASDRTKGGVALLGAAFTYGCFGALIRIMATMFGNNAQVAFRFAVAFLILGAYALLFKRPSKLDPKSFLKVAVLGLAFWGVVILFTISVNLTTLSNSVFLLYAGSIVTSLLIGTIILKEKLTWVKSAAIVLALIGLAMYSSALLALSLGLVTAVLSGVLDGVSNSIRKTLKGIDRNTILLYQYAFGASAALVVLVFAPQGSIKTISVLPVIVGLIFAVALIWLGNLLLYGFQHFDVNVGTVILATELFFATLVGLIFFGEVPALHEMLGGTVIFLASILSTLDPAILKRLTVLKTH
jgi:drug/metabolite transporter (DMT)-like permease